MPEGDEEALKEAVYSRGPLAVSLDAGHPSFRFYSHGKHHSIIDKQPSDSVSMVNINSIIDKHLVMFSET